VTNRSVVTLFATLISFPWLAGAATCKQQVLDGPRVLVASDPSAGPNGYAVYQVDPDATTDLGYGNSQPDTISFEFYTFNSPALAAGTFDLGSALNSNYSSCDQCVLAYRDFAGGVASQAFFQTAGTLTVDGATIPGSDPITMTWQNVNLIEVTIDPSTFESTPVPNGDCYDIVPDKLFVDGFEGN